MEKYIKNFLEYLEVEKGLSLITIRNYGFYLRRFAEFAKQAGVVGPAKISKELVYGYRLWFNAKKRPALSTEIC